MASTAQDPRRITFVLPITDGVWAHNATVTGDRVPVTVAGRRVASGAVVSAVPAPGNPEHMHVTMELTE